MSRYKRKLQVAIIDIGLGNLFSIKNACNHVGMNAVLTSLPDIIHDADAVILPGMGAYGDAMCALESFSLVPELKKFVRSGKPFMGICLGMHILMDYGTEFGHYEGLGLVRGHAERFQNPNNSHGPLKVPEICWNQLFKRFHGAKDPWESSPLQNLPDGIFMYFNHSYYVKPADVDNIIATTTYGDCTFCSGLKKGNIFGFQCHPERSGNAGIFLYKNFAEMIEQSI